MSGPARSSALPPPYGARLVEGGAQFCVHAGHAQEVTLCLFDEDGTERAVPMTPHAHGAWSTHVPGAGAGQRYGYRVTGPWDPARGHRHNPAKLLLDPYARAIEGRVDWKPEVFGHRVDHLLHGSGTERDDRDSAPFVPRSVLVDEAFDHGGVTAPGHSWEDTVLYEAHVVGLTRTLTGVPEHLRGTYAGVAHPVTIAHLHRLGVTAVELLPVHASTTEPAVAQRGLSNYWGYNTLGFFAPHAAYAAARDPQGVLDEVKGMVKLLHLAGIEVILDVVYNHTAEQDGRGATLSWRGLDNRAYYRLDADGRDIDVTGCGNTLDTRQPVALRMVLDSLRYWVTAVGVDGFRFDLAVALARGRDGEYDPDHPFLMALRTDPVLSRVKLIAEPWDVGPRGWRTGQLPPPFAEWNDAFRDTVRDFWLPGVVLDADGRGGAGIRDLGTRIAGSADLFAAGRGPLASISFVTAHDGFTLADLTSYDTKHNEANGESNHDGSGDNRSWNHGHEGPEHPFDPGSWLERRRRRSRRNLLATLLLSSGVPMLLAGDEIGRTQRGNNNPYCQDNEISWLDWELDEWQEDLIATTAALTAFRRAHPVLRQPCFFPGSPMDGDRLAALHWHGPDGEVLTAEQWGSPTSRTLQVVFDGADVGDDRILMVLHGAAAARELVLPTQEGVARWDLVWASPYEHPEVVRPVQVPAGDTLRVEPASFLLLVGRA